MTLPTTDDFANREHSIDELETIAAPHLTEDELDLISGGGDPDDGGQFRHQRA